MHIATYKLGDQHNALLDASSNLSIA